MSKIDIAGLKIDAITKKQLLEAVFSRIKGGQKTFITTPYSEFLYHAFREPKLLEVFNKADFAVADGIGIFWAKRYLEIPLISATLIRGRISVSYWLMILQALWQLIYSLAAVVFYPKWIKSALPEKIVGADLVWDLAKLAANNNLSIFLLGGFGETPEKVKQKIISQFPNLLISVSNKNPNNPAVINDINNSHADLLFVAYGPVKQEQWIANNLPKLNIKLAIGVGGSFDYIAGTKSSPPKFVRYSGLEWLWRLITQPYRFTRIINATFGLAWSLWHYKVFNSLPLRKNVVLVILNKEGLVLLGERNPKDFYIDIITTQESLKMKGYWQLPQGGIDGDEDLVAAAKREAREETGIKNLELIKISQKSNVYIWNNALRGFWKNRHKQNIGQVQHIVYFKFLGQDSEVIVDQKEFINLTWIKLEDLMNVIHPERKALAEIVLKDLA
jgi:N-acetylglucosaminyldiphosphoundecaprenol N-acetyl-beta-D-mannosaminyltransferase